LKYVFLLLTLIILSGSFGFSLAQGKGYEGGFPESSGLSKYRMGNMGAKREPEPKIQYDQSEERYSNEGGERRSKKEKEISSNNQKSSKDSES